MVGTTLNIRVRILDRFCIPAPVAGGLLFVGVIIFLRGFDIVTIELDTPSQGLIILTFFTPGGLEQASV